MIKKISKILLVFVLILILSLLFEVFLFHGNLIFGGHLEKNYINVDDYEGKYLNSSDDEKDKYVVSVNFGKKYVNKLRIYYSSDKDIESSLVVYREDELGKDVVVKDPEIFHSELPISVRDYHYYIDKIDIISDDKIEIDSIQIDNTLSLNYYRIFYLFVFFWCCFLGIIYFRNKKFFKNIEYLFLMTIIPIGIMLIVVQPPLTFFSWDDQNHYENTFKLLDSNVEIDQISTSFMDPFPFRIDTIDSIEEQYEIIDYLNNNSNKIVSREQRSFLVRYSEVGYILPSIGIHICHILKAPFSITFRVGKIINLLFYAIVVFLAIKNIKIGKRIMFVIGMLPTSFYMACQYSYDPPITAAILLGFSFLVNVLCDKNCKMDLKNTFMILIPLIFASFIKAVYAPLILLVLFIPKDRFVSSLQSKKFKFGIIFIFLLLVSTFVLPTLTSPNVVGDLRGGETSEAGQLATILHHPFGYMLLLKDTMISQFFYKLFSKENLTFFSYAGLFNDNLYYIYLFVLLFVAFTDTDREYQINKFVKIFLFILVLGIIVLIWTSLYMSFTDVGSNVINGVQARYFIPLLFPLILCFRFNNIKNNFLSRYYDFIVVFIPTFVLLFAIYELIIKIYCC